MTETTPPARGWRQALADEVSGALSQLRRARRPTVVREAALQTVVALAGVVELLGGLAPTTPVAAAFLPWTAVALLARRRWPALALVALAPPVGLDAPGVALAAVVVAFTYGRRRVRPRRRLLVLVVVTALCLAMTPLVPIEDTVPLKLADAALGAVVLGLVVLAGVLLGHRRLATSLLRERNDHLERTRAMQARQARLEEQARITSEMHDVLGHRLSLLAVHAGALELAADAESPRFGGQARLVRTTAVAALDELRATLAATPEPPRGPAPALDAAGGEAAVEELADASRRAGAQVDVLWRADGPPPPPGVGRAVDRAVREGLTNAGKHAPGTPVTITVERSGGRVRASVRNGPPVAGTGDGDGASPGPGTRLGLLGLAERARLLGGHAAWGPADDGGFELVVEVPADPSTAPDGGTARDPADGSAQEPPGAVPPLVRGSDVLTGGRVAALVGIGGVVLLPVVLVLALVLALVLLLLL